MSENKQTLFRFRTMRAPKEFDPMSMYLITSPGVVKDGVFFTAVAEREPGTSVAEAMAGAAATFVPLGAGAKDVNFPLYVFGDYIIKNRSTLTYAELETAYAAVTTPTLSDEDLTEIWDNLFYQTLTMGSPNHREALLKLVLGHTAATAFPTMPETDEMAQFLANSRIVLPKELFGTDNPYAANTAVEEASPNLELLLKHLTVAENQARAQLGIAALNDLAQYKTRFYRENLPDETSAIARWMDSIRAIVDNAKPTLERDPITGELKKTINPNLPSPDYDPVPEIDPDEMDGEVAGQTLYLMNELGLTGRGANFDQVEKGLKEYILGHQNEAFSRTAFHTEKLSVNGTLFSRCDVESGLNPSYGYLLSPVPADEGKYKLLLVVHTGSDCLKPTSARLTVGTDLPQELTDFVCSARDGVLTVDFTPKGAIAIPDGATPDMDVELVFGNESMLRTETAAVFDPGKFVGGQLEFHALSTTALQPFAPSGFGLNRLGISDFMRVEQELCCYVPGEVSHIENIMAREYKERSTRRLRRSEESLTQTSSQEREHLTDTSSTSRFDMQQEVSEVISQTQAQSTDISFNAGLSGKSDFLVSEGAFTIDSGFSSNSSSTSSQEQSESQSISVAKEITEKVQDRLVSKISEERVRKIVEEFEEQNRHGFDNRKGAEHISGVYRWVDKVYKNQVYNYGKRLQYEFMIPEPASFHLSTKSAANNTGDAVVLTAPDDPRTTDFGLFGPLSHAGLLHETNYQQWAAAYGATVTPPPAEIRTVSKTLIRPQDGSPYTATKTVNDEIQIPEGYGIRRIWCSAMGDGAWSVYDNYRISVAGNIAYLYSDTWPRFLLADHITYPNLERYVDSVPVTVQFTHLIDGMFTAELELVRKPELFAEWQLETFNAIVSAYEDRLAEYESKRAEEEAAHLQMTADNPKYLRRIENTVLKKNCMSYLIGHQNMGQNYLTGTAASTVRVQLSASMDQYAAKVKFFEQAFEWELMDYMFYPFYWGDRGRWYQLYNLENDDALFRSFLQSGMARLILPVRPGFEEAVLFYMRTGLIWNGGEMPVFDDELYKSIIDELRKPPKFLKETWETRVPSTLTVIQAKSIALDAEGLPCCDDTEAPVPVIRTPETDPLANLEVFIPGEPSGEEPEEEPQV